MCLFLREQSLLCSKLLRARTKGPLPRCVGCHALEWNLSPNVEEERGGKCCSNRAMRTCTLRLYQPRSAVSRRTPLDMRTFAALTSSFLAVLRRLPSGSWLRAIDFGCAQYVEEGVPLTRKTGTPMFMVRSPLRFTAKYCFQSRVTPPRNAQSPEMHHLGCMECPETLALLSFSSQLGAALFVLKCACLCLAGAGGVHRQLRAGSGHLGRRHDDVPAAGVRTVLPLQNVPVSSSAAGHVLQSATLSRKKLRAFVPGRVLVRFQFEWFDSRVLCCAVCRQTASPGGARWRSCTPPPSKR